MEKFAPIFTSHSLEEVAEDKTYCYLYELTKPKQPKVSIMQDKMIFSKLPASKMNQVIRGKKLLPDKKEVIK